MQDDKVWMVKQASNIELNGKIAPKEESPKTKRNFSPIRKEHIRRSLQQAQVARV